MASLPVRIAFSNNVSLDSLNQMQFSTGAHCVYNLKAHLIFVVAYRRKAISSTILQRLIEIFSEVCQSEQAQLLECSGERDHVQRLISYPPKLCLSDFIRKLKVTSPLKVRQEFDRESHHLLWGKRFWTKSDCMISVGDGATTAIIEQYIKLTFARPLSIPALTHGEFRGIR